MELIKRTDTNLLVYNAWWVQYSGVTSRDGGSSTNKVPRGARWILHDLISLRLTPFDIPLLLCAMLSLITHVASFYAPPATPSLPRYSSPYDHPRPPLPRPVRPPHLANLTVACPVPAYFQTLQPPLVPGRGTAEPDYWTISLLPGTLCREICNLSI